jgi:hypothetical protein
MPVILRLPLPDRYRNAVAAAQLHAGMKQQTAELAPGVVLGFLNDYDPSMLYAAFDGPVHARTMPVIAEPESLGRMAYSLPLDGQIADLWKQVRQMEPPGAENVQPAAGPGLMLGDGKPDKQAELQSMLGDMQLVFNLLEIYDLDTLDLLDTFDLAKEDEDLPDDDD